MYGFTFTIQNVPIKFKDDMTMERYLQLFTIQNVPIKCCANNLLCCLIKNLQYKMFLLNEYY